MCAIFFGEGSIETCIIIQLDGLLKLRLFFSIKGRENGRKMKRRREGGRKKGGKKEEELVGYS